MAYRKEVSSNRLWLRVKYPYLLTNLYDVVSEAHIYKSAFLIHFKIDEAGQITFPNIYEFVPENLKPLMLEIGRGERKIVRGQGDW